MKKTDFFLISFETREPFEPRSCFIKKRIAGEKRDDGMLIAIDPPLIGQPYGLGDKDIKELIIFSRLKGSNLFPIKEWPLHVYIYRLLNPSVISQDRFSSKDVEMIMWGEIYPTPEAVREEINKFSAWKK